MATKHSDGLHAQKQICSPKLVAN